MITYIQIKSEINKIVIAGSRRLPPPDILKCTSLLKPDHDQLIQQINPGSI